MNTNLSAEQITSYRTNGFLVIEDFLDPQELEIWREAVTVAVRERNGIKIPGKNIETGKEDGINEDSEYFGNVFDQLVNLWQTNEQVKELILDERIGKMAAHLAQVDGIRVWHDQALIKKPWANPTAWHLDTPYWSFDNREALSIWIALDDATLENGCLFFIPGSHQKTTFKDPGITKNMNAIFLQYPEFSRARSVAAPMKAGSCSFHNGLCIHGAHANMTPGFRRAMTCAFMPDGSVFNGKQNVLSDEYAASLKPGHVLNNDLQNPLLYSNKK
ncbi:MAG: phytanoyl-CoA dioxygenase family protein [Flavobacterium sp.]|nr:phytanoyl-CoA dioxygenase family protein [Flavobacterium sp.]